MAFSKVQIFEVAAEGSGARGAGRARQAAPCSVLLYDTVAWWFASPAEFFCSSQLVVRTRLYLSSLFSG